MVAPAWLTIAFETWAQSALSSTASVCENFFWKASKRLAMVWYKAWLESRVRFLIAITLVAALFAFDIAQARIVMPQLGLAPTDFNQFVWRISFTRGAFICALGTLILCPGGLLRENVLGTALFTLSLPISRRKWLASRTLVALMEAA